MFQEIDMNNQRDSVTNRVAGFICKHVFTEHKQVVSAMAVIGREAGFGGTFLVCYVSLFQVMIGDYI